MSLADSLRRDRERVADGRLTMDRVKAREKMRAFQLPDPHMYVLQLVRAANAAGATRIDFGAATDIPIAGNFDANALIGMVDVETLTGWRAERTSPCLRSVCQRSSSWPMWK